MAHPHRLGHGDLRVPQRGVGAMTWGSTRFGPFRLGPERYGRPCGSLGGYLSWMRTTT
jgi:hypothetical protein